jgi:hypothetical protein
LPVKLHISPALGRGPDLGVVVVLLLAGDEFGGGRSIGNNAGDVLGSGGEEDTLAGGMIKEDGITEDAGRTMLAGGLPAILPPGLRSVSRYDEVGGGVDAEGDPLFPKR